MGKTPLPLDWSKLLPEKDTSEPPELTIVDGGPASELTNHQIQEKLRRLCATLGSDVVFKLPDKGERLQSNVKQLQDELTRRELARVHKQEFEDNSASSQVFWLLKESELTPSNANILDGRYAVFGYVTENEDCLADLKVGDIIESIQVVSGLDNLVNPSYKIAGEAKLGSFQIM